ncbi:hypothetical protein HNP55_003769 [Paucibacter oligotrophus]|uniref:Uncharacterized protein n=1 Tax=Roseateles oligotrophus TaxID=1769250 RepID=A0A840LF04_9BURK|nr:hypothetical protein [Roseateles oligotrophus]MBB4845222.1 hypothetical protein [Roseateles oligotrophus]
MKGILGPLLALIGGAMALYFGLILLYAFWPLVVLAAGLTITHSPKAMGLAWSHWEWLAVLGAVWLQVRVSKSLGRGNSAG